MSYPAHYHAACSALVRGGVKSARNALARSLRAYRRDGQLVQARELRWHASVIGWPVRRRASGRYA